jgi:UDP-N-acetylglucosamine--N-acetylmuramyl-(pentapeptide) pyrophosphoryl-undecaprenol N-acetylglucosamine transferase
MKVLIACGGTGGHLFPGLAVAEMLLTRGHGVRLVISEKTVDRTASTALTSGCGQSGISIQTVSAVGFSGSRQLMHFCIRLAQATRECRAVCENFKPDAVLGMGGFTSAPAVLAARWQGSRTLIHESNAVPGKANRWAGNFADHVAVGLKDCARFFGQRPVTVTGTPVRSQLRSGKIADARERFGLDPARVTILVMGGSQGARAINEAVVRALPALGPWRSETQFVHLTGGRDEMFVRDAYRQSEMAATVMSFCNEMELAYSAADVVVARAGASTLTEIAVFGLPAVLIPFPQAVGNHQLHNARVFERIGAAHVIEQREVALLPHVVGALLSDDAKRRRMSSAARSLAVDDAAERIVDLLEQAC